MGTYTGDAGLDAMIGLSSGDAVEPTAYPTGTLGGDSGGGTDWTKFAQSTLDKALGYFTAKDLAVTRSNLDAQQRFYRVPGTGQVVPVGTMGQMAGSSSANMMPMLLLLVGGVIALKALKVV